jgi:hypothetical protein
MARRDGDNQAPEPAGGKAEARLQQFLRARGLASDHPEEHAGEQGEDDDTAQAAEDTGRGDRARDDRDEESGD